MNFTCQIKNSETLLNIGLPLFLFENIVVPNCKTVEVKQDTSSLCIISGCKAKITGEAQKIYSYSHRKFFVLYAIFVCKGRQFIYDSIVWNKVITFSFNNILYNFWQRHAHLVKGIFLTSYECVELIQTDTPDQTMSHLLPIYRRLPFDILRLLRNCLYKKACAIIVTQ